MSHDHRQSMWVVAPTGGPAAIYWCYQCGAWRPAQSKAKRVRWHKPTGIGGPNPAMKERANEQS